jgi:glutathione S-transferase
MGVNAMKLYYMPGASSLAAHIVLKWTGAVCDLVRLDRRAIKGADYLSLNPVGKVPLLLHGDLVLTESVAILAYLAELHPLAGLLGDPSPRARADVMRCLAFLNSDVDSAFRPIFVPHRYLQHRAFARQISDTARDEVRQYLRLLDAQMRGREWLTGSRSIADAYLFVMLRWAVGTKVGLSEFANLRSFASRMHEDLGVHAALVAEEGLTPRGTEGLPAGDALERLNDLLGNGEAAELMAEVIGAVEYREGEGIALEVPRGMVRVEATPSDTVLSWIDETYRGEAAIPYANFSQYVGNGAIRLAL